MYFGVLGETFGNPELPKAPPRRQGGEINRESGSWVLRGSSPGLSWESKSYINRSRCETNVEKHCAQSAAQEASGDRSNHENDGFIYSKPLFSNFHPSLQNDRKLLPMGTPLPPYGMPWVPFWFFGRVLGTGWNFDGFWDPPCAPPGTTHEGVDG